MKERNIDFIFASIMIAINFIQIYGLLYNQRINFPFRDDLYANICELCDLIRVYPIFQPIDGSTGNAIYYWVLAFALILILVLYFFMLLFIDYSIKIDKFYFIFPIKLLSYLSSFFYWIFMMPTIEIFVSIFSCNDDGNHVVDPELECWTGLHLFYCILFSLSLFGYFIIFLLVSSFFNESRPYHTDSFSRLDTNMETYLTLYKILITIIGHFLYQPQLHWLIITIHILGSLNFCKLYL